jgi:hypothetical protein
VQSAEPVGFTQFDNIGLNGVFKAGIQQRARPRTLTS